MSMRISDGAGAGFDPSPFVPSAVEGRGDGSKGVSTSLDTNGVRERGDGSGRCLDFARHERGGGSGFRAGSIVIAAALLLAACSSGGGEAPAPGAADDRIECQAADEAEFRRVCEVERLSGDKGELVLTIRHPSGSFRRLLVTRDGRGVVAADGAEAAVVTVIQGNRIEVAIAGDRYRLPATVKTP